MDLFDSITFQLYIDRLPASLQATLFVAFGSLALGVALGLVLAFLQRARFALISRTAHVVVTVGRSIPVFPLLLVIYFGFLALNVRVGPLLVGILAIGMHVGPFLAESFRAGLQAVPPRLIEAGYALGMSSATVRRRIVLPVAFRLLLPAIGHYTVISLLSSAAVSTIGGQELTNNTRNIIDIYFATELWVVLALTYFILAFPLSRLFGILERRYTIAW